jgi:hypothetical protein
MAEGLKEYRQQIADFVTSAKVINAILAYEESEDNEELLENIVKETSETTLFLPSGRRGTHIALSLELGCLNTALYLMSNRNKLGLYIPRYSSYLDGEMGWTLRDHFDNALYVYEGLKEDESKKDAIGYLRRSLNIQYDKRD